MPLESKRIVLFASGSGTNVENVIRHFADTPEIVVACVLTNKRDAQVLERCSRLNVSAFYFNRHAFFQSDAVLELLKCQCPDLIILAGFLWKIPENIIEEFPGRIVNIHPALLPKYGGQGMYGIRVHEAVRDSGDTETGITIHFVDAHYDEGAIIEQVKVPLEPSDGIAGITAKVHALEYEYLPKVIERLLFPHQ